MKMPTLDLSQYQPYADALAHLDKLRLQLHQADADLDATSLRAEMRSSLAEQVAALTSAAPAGPKSGLDPNAAYRLGTEEDVSRFHARRKVLTLAVREQEAICRRLARDAGAHLDQMHDLRGGYTALLRKVYAAAAALGQAFEAERRYREALIDAEVRIPCAAFGYDPGGPEIDRDGNKSPLCYWLEVVEAAGYKVR